MKAWVLRFLIALIVIHTNVSAQGTLSRTEVDKLQVAVARVWPKAERIWPGTDFSKLILLLTDGQTLFEVDAAQVRTRPWSEVATQVRVPPGGFASLEWNSRPAIAVSVAGVHPPDFNVAGQAVPWLFAFATHEAFHVYAQERWPASTQSDQGIRATDYPVKLEPRLMRLMLFRNLLGNAERSEAEALGRAAYWYEGWRKTHTHEAESIAPTDLAEGTAAYFETVAVVRAAIGFDAPTDQYRDALWKLIGTSYDAIEPFTSVDNESYGLGAVAGALADDLRPNWKDAAEHGKPILETLFSGVTPLATEASAADRRELEAAINTKNTLLGPKLEPFLERWRTEDTVLMVLPFAPVGSFSLLGFFASEAAPSFTLMADITTTLRLSSGEVALQAVTAAMGIVAVCNPNAPSIVIPVRPSELRFEGSRARIALPGLNLSFEPTRAEFAGHPVLCAP